MIIQVVENEQKAGKRVKKDDGFEPILIRTVRDIGNVLEVTTCD